ncbi:hypothetical protein LCGC14_0547980 [marine sediment metagenome]|uniref:Uncharacterized protein n=1 Tax=marine sediment metagenome TaxID=412755 RepID=A0A0F9UCB2_9ZZZZ
MKFDVESGEYKIALRSHIFKLANDFDYYINWVSKRWNIPKWQVRTEYWMMSF